MTDEPFLQPLALHLNMGLDRLIFLPPLTSVVVLEIEFRASLILGRHLAIELHFQSEKTLERLFS